MYESSFSATGHERKLIDSAEQGEQEVASFEEYRQLFDKDVDNFRHLGILSPEGYTEAVTNPITVMAQVDGKTIPAIVPLSCEGGYDTTRTQYLMNRKQALFLAIPLKEVMDGALRPENIAGGHGLEEGFGIVVEEPANLQGASVDAYSRNDIARAIRSSAPLEIGDFVDERLVRHAENRTAWMGLYDFSFEPTSETGQTLSMEQAWDEVRSRRNLPLEPAEDSNETYLYTTEELANNQKLVDDLWAISQIGFGKVLGEYHPVSMEETKEFFDQVLFTEGTYTAVRYADGAPVCFGSLTENLKDCTWLDDESTAMTTILNEAAQAGEKPLYFSEIISNGEKGARYSPDVLNTFFEVTAVTGNAHKVIFESTNLSSRYVPLLVKRACEYSEYAQFRSGKHVRLRDKLDYWYLTDG